MAEGIATPPTVSDVTLQQQFEQLEAAISEGHGILNRIQGTPVSEDGKATATEVGGLASSQRCQSSMQDLLRRLNEVANVVGQV